MLSKILDKATGLVDSRFLLVAFFPVIVTLAGVTLLLSKLDSSLLSSMEKSWGAWSGSQQWLSGIAAIAALFVLSYVVYVSITPIVRFFEGYFGPLAWIGELFPSFGKARGSAVRDPLLYLKYPGDNDHFPTRLGNSLRAAEVHPRNAYGLDSVLLWPHLVAQLPDTAVKSIDAARMSLDFLTVITAAASGYTVFAGVAITLEHGGLTLWIAVVLASAIIAYVAYCGAVAAARDYGDQVRTAFDQNRFALLTSLHLPLPNNRPEERRLWSEVNDLVRASEPPDWWLYEHPKADS